MILKAIDLGLMSEHLTTHKGVLKKLQFYFCSARNSTLKQIVYEQFLIMRNHVQVMLRLMDPTHNEIVSVLALDHVEPVEIPYKQISLYIGDKNIALEARNTSKSMAHDNFSSALMMMASNVRNVHVHMALQQVKLQERYTEFIEKMGWGQTPNASLEEQKNTMKRFQHLFHIQSD